MEVDHYGAMGIPGVKDPLYPVPTVYLNLAHPLTIAAPPRAGVAPARWRAGPGTSRLPGLGG
jgi:hypothetical protein